MSRMISLYRYKAILQVTTKRLSCCEERYIIQYTQTGFRLHNLMSNTVHSADKADLPHAHVPAASR
jgi:hypothetical protein